MLAPLNASSLPDFTTACAHDRVFGSRALTALHTYGLGDPHARFFLCLKGREPAAALYLADKVLTVSADDRADPAPIAELAAREGVHEIDTNRAQCEALQRLLGGTIDSSYTMVYRGGQVEEIFTGVAPGELGTVFSVLQRSHEYYRTHLQFDPWAADLSRKLDRGLSEVYQLTRGGEVVGTGCIASEDDECGVIAAVAVVPEWQRQGFGSLMTRFLVQRIRQKGKTPLLLSGYDAVAEVYRKIGFSVCGRWGELYL